MRHLLLTLAFAILVQCTLADTLSVKIDGTGDYIHIQTAIYGSSSGDVILVYPGTYYENIDCYGRDNLTIASLYLINPVDSNLHNTIINGDQQGSCFVALSGEQNLRFLGLTITNGAPKVFDDYNDLWYGSGIYLDGASVSVEHCIITGNCAEKGGGIQSNESQVFLSKTKIFNNQAYLNGGGIFAFISEVIFDTINLCDLYLNYAPRGTDCFLSYPTSLHPIILDTATVLYPDYYYIRCGGFFDFPSCDIELEVKHAKIQDVNADVYVSPFGDDANSGLTSADPLKTLSFALLKIKSDSLNHNTIHIGNGIYSPSNGNIFPIGFKCFVPIVGEDASNTVIDLDSLIYFGMTNSGDREIILKNFTIRTGMEDSICSFDYIALFYNCRYVLLDNLKFLNCTARSSESSILSIEGCDSVFINNSLFKENHVDDIIYVNQGYGLEQPLFTELSGCRILKNFACGGLLSNTGLRIDDGTARIINSEISGNSSDIAENSKDNSIATDGILLWGNVLATIVNSTIANHYIGEGLHILGAEVHLYNCIFSGNEEYQIEIGHSYDTTRLYLYSTLVQGGENGILNNYPDRTIIYYDSTNIDDNPGWINTGEFPYALTSVSPCINTGTLDLPEGIVLPITDLTGGPRISGGEVDLGAYEFLFVGIDEDAVARNAQIRVSPNPFKNNLTISFETEFIGKEVEIDLYDLQGNLVQSVYHGEVDYNKLICFPGDEEAKIHPGVYLLRLTVESSISNTVKVIKFN